MLVYPTTQWPLTPERPISMVKRERFPLILVKASHYDDDGYVIQWMRCAVPSNSLAVVIIVIADHILGF